MLTTEIIWSADAYLRLSKEDGDKDESNSIKNQRDLILDFVSNDPAIRIVNILSDDGFTGANFDRDAFQTVIDHIDQGVINCVIVKDFSRLGRDHIGALKYIQRYFVSKKVRFISINDGYDSLYADMSDSNTSLIVPFKTIINEAFLEDISLKTKTQLAIKRKNGEFIGNYATYGYVKTGDKKLVADEYAAEVVKTIFDHKLMGQSEQQIADVLNAGGVLSPAEYKKASGQAYNTPFAIKEKSLWTVKALRRILTNRVYIGVLEQGKRTKASYRVKKHFYVPREAWSVHENNHEPIISEHDFYLVQELMAIDTRVSGDTGRLHLFSGIMVCGACGQPMTVKTAKKANGKSYVNYICSTHKRDGSCKNNNISSLSVEKLALQATRQHITVLLSADELAGNLGLGLMNERKKAAIEGMIDKAVQSIEEHNSYLVKSYAHMLDGVITEKEYKVFREEFRRQIDSAEKSITHMRREIERLSDKLWTNELIEVFRAHENITELDRRAVVSLIQSIIVHNGSKDVEICFRFGGGFDNLPGHADAIPERMVV